ncbi:hypothetical protein [Actinoplanes regularis]|uniref:hypothetical protein n=1 Tax=Actinoplanes regularis TaxID=52697 RepID=UPI0025533700|nr:hypothetical protein [Actinoplanes regularis]GLW27850.1 hypothetical protein Areg01_07900 [Actinoplanes regularis]
MIGVGLVAGAALGSGPVLATAASAAPGGTEVAAVHSWYPGVGFVGVAGIDAGLPGVWGNGLYGAGLGCCPVGGWYGAGPWAW